VLLIDRLWVYSNSAEARAIQNGYQDAVDKLWLNARDATAQCFVATATWSLSMWEAYLGLLDGAALDEQVRSERIISKLRGSGVSTPELVERVAESYYNGDCEVTEQFSDYTFTIKFLSTRGKPPGLEQLKAAIEEIKPAHLAVLYVFMYTTHGELSPFTHTQLHGHTHEQLRTLMA